jgi:predicted O-methyltransferase YrrM
MSRTRVRSKRFLGTSPYVEFVARRAHGALESARGVWDLPRLRYRIPEFRSFESLARESSRELEPHYREYVSSVSTPGMSVSIELAVFLDVICRLTEPDRILDLGSGFSSFVFRRYLSSKDVGVHAAIWSIDDSPEWLQQTRAYLGRQGLSTENLMTWEVLCRRSPAPFDLVLHDLGRMPLRQRVLDDVLAFCRARGFLVLDDVHKSTYRAHAARVLKRAGLDYFSLRRLTLDSHGRYSWLVQGGVAAG